MKDEGAADGKATHCPKDHSLREFSAKVQGCWEKRPYSKENACNIEPHRRPKVTRFAVTELNLQQHRGRANQRHYHQRHRAAKRRRTGEHHHQGQGDTQESRAKNGFALRQWQGTAIV